MSRWQPIASESGAILQAGIPFGAPKTGDNSAHLVRGVVMAVYLYDDPGHPYPGRAAAMYMDVLTYSAMAGSRTNLVRNVLLTTSHAQLQSGKIAKPRATSGTLNGEPLTVKAMLNPANLNGDHCLLGFIDNRRSMPVLVGWLPPPAGDGGHLADSIGRRTRLRLLDGDPCYTKHHGTYWGVDDDGNFRVDASAGNSGKLAPDGSEVPGPGGNVDLRAGAGKAVLGKIMDPTGKVELAELSMTASGLKVQCNVGPASLTVVGTQGPILAISGGGAAGLAAVSLGASATAFLVDAVTLTTYLAALTTWLLAKVPGAAATPPPPVPPLANPKVRVPQPL